MFDLYVGNNFMAKEIQAVLKLQIPAGQATPAPPVGPALGQHGVNIGEFISRFNEETKEMDGELIPVEVTIYKNRSFDLVFKTPPASYLLKKAAGIEKGSGEPHKVKVGTVTKEDVKKIAERKMKDLNTNDIKVAVKIIEGTARNMGIDVV